MTYYFPIGRPATIPTNIDYSLTAVTASAGAAGARADTASYAASVQNLPATGAPGTNQNLALCTNVIPGNTGPQGDVGPQGTSLTVCPPGSKQCALTPPSGFSLVCIEIPEGCTAAGTPCPTTLEGFATTTTTSTTSTTTAPPCYELGTFIYATTAPDVPANCTVLQYEEGPATLYSTCETPENGCVIYSNAICTTTAVSAYGIHSFVDGAQYVVLNGGTSAVSGGGSCDPE
jgi:hypothetical protein